MNWPRKWPNAGAGHNSGGRKQADPSTRARCWFHIPIGCTAPPEFVVTLAQAKSRAGFQSAQGGKQKGIRRYLCRAHLSLFQRPLVDLAGITIGISNLNPVTDSVIATEDE